MTSDTDAKKYEVNEDALYHLKTQLILAFPSPSLSFLSHFSWRNEVSVAFWSHVTPSPTNLRHF